MTNKSSRKNYDDIPAELSLLEKVKIIREKALKLKIKSPDISKMIRLEVPREQAWYYLPDEDRLSKRIEKLKKIYGENLVYKIKRPLKNE